MPKASKTYVVIQQGGSSREMYVHVFDGMDQVEDYKKGCEEAAYAVSEPIEVPKAILGADDEVQQAVWGVLDGVARAAADMV